MQPQRSTLLFILSLLLIGCLIQIPLLQPSIESGKEELYWIAEARHKPDMTHRIQYPENYWNDRINFLIDRTNKQVFLQNLFWTLGVLGILLFLCWLNLDTSNKKNGCSSHPAWILMLVTLCMLFSFISWFFFLNAIEMSNKFDDWHDICFRLLWVFTPISLTAALLLANKQSNAWSLITSRQKRTIRIVWISSVVLFIIAYLLYAYGSVVNGYDLH